MSRIANDNYPTPAWAVHRFLERAVQRNIPTSGSVLEPCAGDGAIIKATLDTWFKPKFQWAACEIRSECESTLFGLASLVFIGDFRELPSYIGPYDLIISNPPFSLAESIIRHAMTMSPWVCMLLRLNFMGSKERHGWLSTNMPDIYVLPNRPPFAVNKHGKLGTDSCEYAWFVWGPHSRGATRGSMELLDQTPLAQRKGIK